MIFYERYNSICVIVNICIVSEKELVEEIIDERREVV